MNPNPHPVWGQWIRGAHHGGAQALQNLALHLYDSRDRPVDLGYLCSMSEDHWEAAMAMTLDYRENGELNGAFMGMCRELADERLARAEADESRKDQAYA
jgi:hypothetical protein